MKSLASLFAIALITVGVSACGSSDPAPPSPSRARATALPKSDRDNDKDKNDDDAHVLDYGRAPDASERQALVALVTGYYAAAATANGARACNLLMPFVAESVAEDLGHEAGLRGSSCAVVMSKLFRQQHTLLSGENATLKFYTVRVDGGRALTVLSFANLPEVRQLTERRDASGAWKVLNLLDRILE